MRLALSTLVHVVPLDAATTCSLPHAWVRWWWICDKAKARPEEDQEVSQPPDLFSQDPPQFTKNFSTTRNEHEQTKTDENEKIVTFRLGREKGHCGTRIDV
jgi:hypothetical protein